MHFLNTFLNLIITFNSTKMLIYIHNERLRWIFEAGAISLCNSVNTRPGFYNISPYLSNGLVFRVFVNSLGDRGSIPGRVIQKTQKMVLIPPCLTLSIIRYGSRVKWSNPGKGVALFPTPRCSSYRKGNLQVTFDFTFYYIPSLVNIFHI